MPRTDRAALLGAGASALACPLSETQLECLLAYLDLLLKWNGVYNLTAIRDPDEMLSLHLLDSLAVIAPLRRHLDQSPAGRAGRWLDVGSGGGLPGVVIAIAEPGLQITCVDTVGKKARFIQQVAAELGLQQLRAVHSRVESVSEPPFDGITARAFATLGDLVALTRPRLTPNGVWLAMKGRRPEAEISALPESIEAFHVEQLRIPGIDAERCIVWMRPRGQP